MRPLAWITSARQSGCEAAHGLVAGYLFDTPPGEVSIENLLDVAPDLVDLFNWGRLVPLDETRPFVVKTYFMPGEEVIRPYREATGKVVYVVRDPRTIIAGIVRGRRVPPEEKARLAVALVDRLDAIFRYGEDRGTWQQHVLDWTSPERARALFPRLEGVCVVRAEDLADDPAGELYRMIEFLGFWGPPDSGRVERTVRDWTAEKVRASGAMRVLPGLEAFHPPPRPARTPPPVPSLAEIGAEVEDAYQRRLQQDGEFATLVKGFGYEN